MSCRRWFNLLTRWSPNEICSVSAADGRSEGAAAFHHLVVSQSHSHRVLVNCPEHFPTSDPDIQQPLMAVHRELMVCGPVIGLSVQSRELIVHFCSQLRLCCSGTEWDGRVSVDVSLASQHFKRTSIQYNNKLRAQHLRPPLDTDCRIQTNPTKQTKACLPALRMHAGGHSSGCWRGEVL